MYYFYRPAHSRNSKLRLTFKEYHCLIQCAFTTRPRRTSQYARLYFSSHHLHPDYFSRESISTMFRIRNLGKTISKELMSLFLNYILLLLRGRLCIWNKRHVSKYYYLFRSLSSLSCVRCNFQLNLTQITAIFFLVHVFVCVFLIIFINVFSHSYQRPYQDEVNESRVSQNKCLSLTPLFIFSSVATFWKRFPLTRFTALKRLLT